MKPIVSIFLIFLFLMQTFSSFVMDAAYFVNRSYVAKNLCINQNKPQLRCNGKCYLSKQIQKENKSDSQANGNKKEKSDTVYFYPSDSHVITDVSSSASLVHLAFHNISLQDYSSTLLKPPGSSFM